MMTRSITFRDLVRRIHPDVNKGIHDAGGKMRQAVQVRNQPEELYKLAIRWGVSDLQYQEPTQKPQPQPVQPPRYGWVRCYNENPRVGDHIIVFSKGNIITLAVRTTAKRVYFYLDGKRQFVHKKNVCVARWEVIG